MIRINTFDARTSGRANKLNPIFRGDAVARLPFADSLWLHTKGVR